MSFDINKPNYKVQNRLSYYLAKYHINGTLVGFEPLTNQLLLCEVSNAELDRVSRYGATMQKSCRYDLRKLAENNENDLPSTANWLYELYLEDADGSLVDVPVAIRNVDASGEAPNEGSDEADWVLTRRFFLIDTVTGIPSEGRTGDNYLNRAAPEIVRYAKSVTLRVNLDASGGGGREETIYTPLLKINYRSRKVIDIEDHPLTTVNFLAEYSMNTDSFWSTQSGFWVFAWILGACVLGARLVVFCLQGNLGDADSSAKWQYGFFKMITDGMDIFSNIFFWYLFAITCYWYTFFKWQENVFILLPPLNTYDENYMPFDKLFACITSFKLASVFFKIIVDQCNFDVFLIDWERPKCKYINNSGKLNVGQNGWRQIFLMNEFCELQVSKLISIEFTLLMFVFLFEGMGLRYWATHDPDVVNYDTNSP